MAKVGQDAPAWLVEAAQYDTSIESLQEYRVLPRVGLLQKGTPDEKKNGLADGTALTVPGGSVIAKLGEPFLLVPVFQFTEFIKWRDRDDTSDNAIVERSMDRKGLLAQICRNPDKRVEPYGEMAKGKQFKFSYQEHLNFACSIYGDHPLAGTVVVISWTKGEFFKGQSFCSALGQRKISGLNVPYWMQVHEFKVGTHKKKGYSWFGFDFQNPAEDKPKYIDEAEAASFKATYEELTKLYSKGMLDVDHTDSNIDPSETVVDDGSM